MRSINAEQHKFIEEFGLLLEKGGGTKTLGRIWGYLLIADKPKTLDEIAEDLLFSKATASLTIRQGLLVRLFEKVSIPGERKTYYRANMQTWVNLLSEKIHTMREWKKLIDYGLTFTPTDNQEATNNLKGMNDYFEFLDWYFSDIKEYYERWTNGDIDKDA
ncbi:hypothetical protein N752_19150 [Desulforamulus aquiferis]|nr:hypothetical protein [Desulforamulus aquiferis]RYD03526.1 hypothetical protein N752_19150 [Desulforamulus aquiferis]